MFRSLRKELAVPFVLDVRTSIFQKDGSVHEGIEIRIYMSDQLCFQVVVKSLSESILLLFICVDIFRSIPSKLHELTNILVGCQGSLL